MITTARIKKLGKHFEILVDLDNALKFRKGELAYIEAEGDKIFKDAKKGEIPQQHELKEAFGTTDILEIAKKIVKEGEIQTTQEYRDAEQEKKFLRVIDFLTKNCFDPKTGHPHTSERIKNALEQANVNIKNVPIENQISEILDKISVIIPIKLETKRIKIKIPAIHTGRGYGVVAQYKESEKWMDDGSLEVNVKVPSGMLMDFYDKLNSVTHGSALTEEIREND